MKYLIMGMTKKEFSNLVLSLAGIEGYNAIVINLVENEPSCFSIDGKGYITPVFFDIAMNDIVRQFREKNATQS